MKALIDADIFCYEFGNMTDLETGELLAWEITRSLVDERISNIISATGATSSVFYLTDSKSNFRNAVATILPYKGHRPSDKPPHWQNIRQHLIDNYDAEVQYGIEADDACGIAQWEDYSKVLSAAENDPIANVTDDYIREYLDNETSTIICSRDKDLSMIPGWHYSWECGKQKEKKWFVSEEEGIRFFYKQLLTGDATDNILGLYRVGEKASCVKEIDDMKDEQAMYELVYMEYHKRFGSYAKQFLLENAQLLWIKREDNDRSEYIWAADEIHVRLELLELERWYDANTTTIETADEKKKSIQEEERNT